jgi:hypothetical protein
MDDIRYSSVKLTMPQANRLAAVMRILCDATPVRHSGGLTLTDAQDKLPRSR